MSFHLRPRETLTWPRDGSLRRARSAPHHGDSPLGQSEDLCDFAVGQRPIYFSPIGSHANDALDKRCQCSEGKSGGHAPGFPPLDRAPGHPDLLSELLRRQSELLSDRLDTWGVVHDLAVIREDDGLAVRRRAVFGRHLHGSGSGVEGFLSPFAEVGIFESVENRLDNGLAGIIRVRGCEQGDKVASVVCVIKEAGRVTVGVREDHPLTRLKLTLTESALSPVLNEVALIVEVGCLPVPFDRIS